MPAWGDALALANLDGDGKLWPLVGTAAWRVHAVCPDGSFRWTLETAAHSITGLAAGDINGDGRDETAVATVYFCVPGITADGERLWQDEDYNDYWMAGPDFRGIFIADVDGDGRLETITAASDTLVHCIDHLGEKKWTCSIGDDPAGIILTDAGIAAASMTGDLHMISGAGQPLWRARMGSPCTALTTSNGHLCVATEDAAVFWVDTDSTGLGMIGLRSPARLLSATADGAILAACEDGSLSRLHC